PGFTVLENEAAVALSHEAREALARMALADPEGPIGQAYSHFAVELDWGAFEALLAMIETDRVKLTDYTARVVTGIAPAPHVLTGADPDETPESLETDFLRWLDRSEWLRMAGLMSTGSTNDQKCAERMRTALWTFTGLGEVFLTGGAARKAMATAKAPADAAAYLTDLQLTYLS